MIGDTIMKKIFTLFLLSVVYSIHAFAFMSNGIYYDIVSETGVEVGFRFGFPHTSSDPNTYYSGDIVIPATVYDAATQKTYKVVGIGETAFSYTPNLTSVVIPEGVEYIGGYAFKVSAVSAVTVPSTVKEIKICAFEQCGALTAIAIPEKIEYIRSHAFYRCTNLKFSDDLLPSTLKVLGAYAFYECKELTQIVIPDGITAIEDYTFQNCSKLESVTLPGTLTSIGMSAFSGCAITDIAIPRKVSSIGQGAFASSGLTSVEIPEGITAIQNNTFNGCRDLSFVVLPSTLETIGQYAFQATAALQSITIPHGVQSIGQMAFYQSGLVSVVLPETVVTIGASVFIQCASLQSVDIHAPAVSIGNTAFYQCSSLNHFSLAAQDPGNVTLGYGVFSSSPISTATLWVPCGTSNLYRTSSSTPAELTDFGTITDKPNCVTVTTLPANSVTQTSAILQGSIKNPNSQTISSKGFEYKELSSTNGWEGKPVSGDNLTFELNNLTPYTSYIYRAYVVVGGNTIYGSEQIFRTLPILPAFTDPVVTLNQTEAVLSGSVTKGSETISSKGFEYREISASDWKTVSVTGEPLTATLTGLTACTTYECRSFALTLGGKFYSNTVTFTIITAPKVVTYPATNIKVTSAAISGSIIPNSEIIAQGLQYRKKTDSGWIDVDGGVLSTVLNDLTGNTAYEYKAYATIACGTFYGDTLTFTTLTAPTVTALLATDIKVTSAAISGSVTPGSETITSQGLQYKKASDTDWIPVNGVLSTDLSGLTGNTVYEYRVFAVTASGTFNSTALTFTTLTAPTITVHAATNVTVTSATISGSVTPGSEAVTSRGLQYKKQSDTDWIPVDGVLSTGLSGLTGNTTYEYRVFAVTASDIFYSTTLTFTTIIAPVVTTYAATNVKVTSAAISGSVTPGSEAVTSQGLQYKKQSDTDWIPVNGVLSTVLSDLTGSTVYEYRVFAVTASGTFYGATLTFTTLAVPTVTTHAATNVRVTSAAVSGSVTPGSEAVTGQGFEYKKQSDTDWITVNGVLSTVLSDLTGNTVYEYRVFAVTASDTFRGATLTFTTLTAPAITTYAATNVRVTSATISGSVTPASEAITSQGLQYKKASDTDWIAANGVLSTDLSGLSGNTVYEYMVFAATASGTFYSNVQTFTTHTAPTLETGQVTDVTQTSVTLSGSVTPGSETVTDQGFEYKKQSDQDWIVLSGALTQALSGLSGNTPYEYKVYAITVSGTFYGESRTFTTGIIPPSVTTLTSTNVTVTSATISGSVIQGSETITSRGLQYKKQSDTDWITVNSVLSTTLNSLTGSTVYEYRAFASTASGTVTGVTRTFTTETLSPTLTTYAATNVRVTSAVISGSVTPGSETITSQGLEYKKQSDTDWIPVDGVLSTGLSDLTGSTVYEYRVFATTASNTFYGNKLTFTTHTAPTVVTNLPTDTKVTSLTVSGSVTKGTEDITDQGFEYKKTSESEDSWIKASGALSTTLSDLIENTPYQYKAYAVTASGIFYGAVRTVSTHAAPAVTTDPAILVKVTSAAISGSVIKGTEEITSQGLRYKKTSDSNWTAIDGVLSITLSDLTGSTAYEYQAYAVTASGTFYGSILTFTTLVAPTVVTGLATNVTQTSASLSGTTTAGSETITSRGFEYKKESEIDWTVVNVIPAAISGLTGGITYQYRAYAVTASGTFYGATLTFTTLAAPTIVTYPATDVRVTSAAISGSVTPGPEAITGQGLQYKKVSETDWITISGVLSITLSDLTGTTAYECRVYAVTASGTSYGNIETFTTHTAPTVLTHEATGTDVNVTSALISGSITDGTEAITSQGLQYKKVSETNWTDVSGILSTTLSDLTGTTAYEHRAYAVTASGTFYGAIKTFTTHTAPIVQTHEATGTDIKETSAFVSGSVAQGTETITSKGFEYKKEQGGTWQTVYAASAFEAQLTELSSKTTYNYRAFVVTPSGTYYGQERTFTTDERTGLNEYLTSAKGVSLYPNPATTVVNLHAEGVDINRLTVIITDMQGRVVAELKGADATVIHLGHYNKGVYLVRIFGESPFFEQVEKLIVR